MNGEIQFIADSYLMERTFQVLAELEEGNGPLTKHAQDLSSIFGGIGKSLQSSIGSQVHGKDSGGVLRTVLDFLIPATFFRLSPVLGILVTVAEMFGFDCYSIYEKVVGSILPKLKSGQKVTPQEINDAGKAAIPQASNQATASDDLLSGLRELDAQGQVKLAIFGNKRKGTGLSGIPGLGDILNTWQAQHAATKSPNMWIRMFGFLSPNRRGSLFTGILVWFLKTALLSAGLLAVGGLAAGALGLLPGQKAGPQSTTSTTSPTSTTNTPSTSSSTPTAPSTPTVTKPAPTGAGSFAYRKKPSDIWVENLGSNQPYEQILDWAIDSYPSLDQYQDIIMRTPSFWNIVRDISQQWHPGQAQLVIPAPYTKRDDVIAKFIDDVFTEIQQQKGQK